MLPPSIPISQPVRSTKFGALPSPCTAHIHAKADVLVWFEICELAPNGEYVPAVVEHSDDFPCRGLFLLHQVGIFLCKKTQLEILTLTSRTDIL